MPFDDVYGIAERDNCKSTWVYIYHETSANSPPHRAFISYTALHVMDYHTEENHSSLCLYVYQSINTIFRIPLKSPVLLTNNL